MKPATVLLWTQEEDHEELIAYNLIKAGFVVASVGSEDEIVPQAREINPDVLLVGDCSSEEAYLKITKKVRKKVKPKPVVFCLTTRDDPDNTLPMCRASDICLTLPAKPKKIIKLIQKALDKREKKLSKKKP